MNAKLLFNNHATHLENSVVLAHEMLLLLQDLELVEIVIEMMEVFGQCKLGLRWEPVGENIELLLQSKSIPVVPLCIVFSRRRLVCRRK